MQLQGHNNLVSRRSAVVAGLTVAAGWLVSGCSPAPTTNTTQDAPNDALLTVDAPHGVDEDGLLLFDDDAALSLLWFTDIHGSADNLSRIVAWREAHASYLDDAICTGDMVYSNCENDFDFWTESGAAGTLTCVGNHDRNCGPNGFDFSGFTMGDAYDRYLYPFIGLWGDTVSWTSGATYYYKDYPNQGIRLVVVDSTQQEAVMDAQLAWFKSVLDDARGHGYTVVAASHFMPSAEGKVTCDFSCTTRDPMPSSAAMHTLPRSFGDAVDEFKQAGGSFACWICGHYHIDLVCHAEGHPDQLVLVLACALCQEVFNDLIREEGTTSQDCFNYFTINPANHRVRISRIGAMDTHDGAHRGTIVIDYDKMEIVAAS